MSIRGLFSKGSSLRNYRRINSVKDLVRISNSLIGINLNGFSGNLKNLPLLIPKYQKHPRIYVQTYQSRVLNYSRYSADLVPIDDTFSFPVLSMYLFPFKYSTYHGLGNPDICRFVTDKFVFCNRTIIVPTLWHYLKLIFILYNNDYSPAHYYKYKIVTIYAGDRYMDYGSSDIYKVFSNGSKSTTLFLSEPNLAEAISRENSISRYGFENLDILDSKALDGIDSKTDLEDYLKYGSKLV